MVELSDTSSMYLYQEVDVLEQPNKTELIRHSLDLFLFIIK